MGLYNNFSTDAIWQTLLFIQPDNLRFSMRCCECIVNVRVTFGRLGWACHLTVSFSHLIVCGLLILSASLLSEVSQDFMFPLPCHFLFLSLFFLSFDDSEDQTQGLMCARLNTSSPFVLKFSLWRQCLDKLPRLASDLSCNPVTGYWFSSWTCRPAPLAWLTFSFLIIFKLWFCSV